MFVAKSPLLANLQRITQCSLFKFCSKTKEFPIQTPYKLHKLDKGPAMTSSISAEEALMLYDKMMTMRRMETAAGDMYKEKAVRGFLHLYSGQEAIAAGMYAMLRKVDKVITSYRCHTFTYLMGSDVVGVLAELTGRKSGVSRGKGGSMHMYTDTFFGGNGIVGAQVPMGAGLAFASKYTGDGGVTFAMYGDGAANQGQIFEAYNIAKLWELPCAFVCENNRYAMGTSTTRGSSSTEFYTRGDYVPGLWVDGMDVLAVREAMQFILDYCPKKGPLVVEMETYRYSGHSMSDPGTSYRSRDEVNQMRKTRDPINTFKKKMLDANMITAEQIKTIDSKVKAEIDAAVKIAKSDAVIDLEELTADIYVKCLENEIRGTHPESVWKHKEIWPRK